MDKQIKEKLISDIGEDRYLHSLRVRDLALDLGKIHAIDLLKLEKAALLHDCAKYEKDSVLLKKAEDFDIIKDTLNMYNIKTLHGPVGAKLAEFEYGIKDRDILNSIKYHTTGRENMTDLEKIIYIADYSEACRTTPGVEKVRRLAKDNLDKAVLLIMNDTIRYLIDIGEEISINTIKARNQLITTI